MPVALVTGGNRGLGLELVKQLLDRGYTVHATYRVEKGGLGEIADAKLQPHQMDVRDEVAIGKVVAAIDGPLDLLVNNAGISDGRWSQIADIEFDVVSEVLEVNAISPVRVVQHTLPLLKEAGGATVVMVTSPAVTTVTSPDSVSAASSSMSFAPLFTMIPFWAIPRKAPVVI